MIVGRRIWIYPAVSGGAAAEPRGTRRVCVRLANMGDTCGHPATSSGAMSITLSPRRRAATRCISRLTTLSSERGDNSATRIRIACDCATKAISFFNLSNSMSSQFVLLRHLRHRLFDQSLTFGNNSILRPLNFPGSSRWAEFSPYRGQHRIPDTAAPAR